MLNLHFIHGFLGLPSDWEIFKEPFKNYNCYFHSIEKYIPSFINTDISDFEGWAIHFNNAVYNNQNKNKNILIGYSLGGRLALHALCKNNNYFNAAIIISANPGLKSQTEKQSRIINDNLWANRFLNEKWENVMNAWNCQGVFSNIKNNLIRNENDFNRQEIFNVLTNFSLGKQEDLRNKIKNIKIPILWLAGESDVKFAQIAHEMQNLNTKIESNILNATGHRVPWEKPEEFKEICCMFFNN
jgi:2-succinyl-6-hydroxy-2,4-cyclohexadiene-1-carboxylate synthase